ncbi:oxysterol-binding protein-related protein 11 isoform X2 [Rhipicephalus sanguineus]|uniref:oxysterol-binding protein-related protein 11 isoform X2 n=1 Tax=Rhipicephalus sanguineus TaxID=34632 RepID=UPI001894D668|nr:oxysterol-binding protein-related protein 11 isoform X2 [Rhipicephalus sanguineus]
MDVVDTIKELSSRLLADILELDVDEGNKMRQPLEGQLYKYTNVVKGWQYRWFVLNPDIGMLEYYMLDEVKKGKPRGAVHLAGAVISPSDEDGQMFTVSAACGEVYKLRVVSCGRSRFPGQDAKERQFWINRLRKVAEDHTKTIAQKNPPLLPREIRGPHEGVVPQDKGSGSGQGASSQTVWYTTGMGGHTEASATPAEAFSSVREILARAGKLYYNLAQSIESLPSHGPGFKYYDKDMLLLKATSCATVMCLEQCLSILQESKANFNPAGLPSNSTVEWLEPSHCSDSAPDGSGSEQGSCKLGHTATASGSCLSGPGDTNNSGEVPDEDESGDEDTSIPTEENKDAILQLLSKLKLGMDLTKVALPSYILEPRSLLEVYADFMSYPDMFLRIVDGETPEERLVMVTEWLLCSLYATRKSRSAQKPYNPVLGEMFHCSWQVAGVGDVGTQVTFVAEQVSHHPPVSAFYVECLEKQMCLSASLGIKSNFMGNYVGLQFLGEVELRLLSSGEAYSIGLPTMYWRSLLSEPYIELGGRITVACGDAVAPITFHTKPFYGGKLHCVSGEAKSATGEMVCKVSGEWDTRLELQYADGRSKEWKISELKRQPKRCRPIDAQDNFESRRLWQPVTQALRSGNTVLASHHKCQIEERLQEQSGGKGDPEQGEMAQHTHDAKLFRLEGNVWKYKYPLGKPS